MISDALKVLALTVVWTLMSRHFDLFSILGGILISVIALRMGAMRPRVVFLPSLCSLVRFLYFLVYRIASGSVAVVRAVLSPQKLSPAIVAVPLDSAHAAPAAVFANVLSTTPGSVSIHVDLHRQQLYMHSLFASDRDASAMQARSEFGKPLAKLLREE